MKLMRIVSRDDRERADALLKVARLVPLGSASEADRVDLTGPLPPAGLTAGGGTGATPEEKTVDSLAIVPRRRYATDRKRSDALLAQAHADRLAYYSPDDLTDAQITCARRLMQRDYGYGLSMRLARSTGRTVPS